MDEQEKSNEIVEVKDASGELQRQKEEAMKQKIEARKKALVDLVDDFFTQVDTNKPMRIAVLHNAALEEAGQIKEQIKSEYHPEEIILSMVSPVLGVHTGPRAIAICGYTE